MRESVSVDAINQLMNTLTSSDEQKKFMPVKNHHKNMIKLRVDEYLMHYGVPYEIRYKENITLYCLETCLFDASHANNESAIIQNSEGRLYYQCFHDSCKDKLWKDARVKISGNDSLKIFCENVHAVPPSLSVSNSAENKYIASDQGPSIDHLDALKAMTISIDELIEMDIPPRPLIMSPWLKPGTLAMVCAPRGIGKTWFTVSLGMAIVRKTSLGKWKVDNPVPCLYVDGEMASDELQERVCKLSIAQPPFLAPFNILSAEMMQQAGFSSLNLADAEWREAMYNFLKTSIYKVVFFDNISSLTPGLDENAKADWDPINQWLLKIRFLGIAVVMVHHTSKSGDQRGTSAREDNIDVSIKLSRPSDYRTEDGAKFEVEFTKARGVHGSGAASFTLQLVEYEGRWVWLEGKVGKKIKDKIIIALGQGMAQHLIAKNFKLSPGRISQVKREAVSQGWLDENGHLTEEGQEHFLELERKSKV